MLEIKDILSSCGYRQYEEGRDLYGSKKINDLEISKDTMTGANIVKGIVEENARKYNSIIWVDERRNENLYTVINVVVRDLMKRCVSIV